MTELFPNVVDYGALDQDQLNELRELADQRRREEEEAADKKSKKKHKKSKLKSLKVSRIISQTAKLFIRAFFVLQCNVIVAKVPLLTGLWYLGCDQRRFL